MSAFGGAIARAVAALGGPQTAAVLVVAGLVAGGVGGGLVASGGSRSGPATSTGELPVYPCPKQGPPLLTVAGGQQLLVTGRLADGTWLRIHLPTPGRTEGWVEAAPLTVKGTIDTLPIATCAAEFAVASPAVEPFATLTAIVNATPSPGPTPSPTVPPTSGPTATPNAHPSLASLTASTRTISYDQGSYCPTAVKKVTFTVKAGDTSGLDGVTLFWREPGASTYAQAVMSRTAGTAKSGTWQVTLDTTANGITRAGALAFYAVARDTAGATSKIPASGANSITVAVCANTGPTITSASSSGGSTLGWNPLGVRCTYPTTTNITAVVKDVDGVKSVTLFYRRPGSTTWSSKPMDNTTIPGKWYANLDTLGDKISIPTPPTGTLSWYIKAVDGKNVASQTRTASIMIRRCDTEAQFDGVFPVGQSYSCTTSATIQISTYANDADQPANGLKVVFYWTLSNPRTRPTPISGHMTANLTKGNQYWGTTAKFNGNTFYAGSLTVYAVTTDRYGGTTKTPVNGPYPMSCQ